MKTAREILTNVKATNYGLKFIPITKEDWEILEPITKYASWSDYDRNQVRLHFLNTNGKYAFLDNEWQTPIDNEYDLEELYQMVERGEI